MDDNDEKKCPGWREPPYLRRRLKIDQLDRSMKQEGRKGEVGAPLLIYPFGRIGSFASVDGG